MINYGSNNIGETAWQTVWSQFYPYYFMIVTVKIRQYLALDGVFGIQTNPGVSPIFAVPSK